MNILAVIPARGGSKGVPRKNIKLLGGKPLIAWTIEAALKCHKIDCVVVTSDDTEIRRISFDYGASTIVRPSELAQDDTPMIDVVDHAIREEEVNAPYDWILLLQPTSPFRKAKDIRRAIKIARTVNCDSVVSVVQVGDHHPARMYSINGKGYLDSFYPIAETKRRQDLPPLYLRNGAIYLTRRDVIMSGRMWGDKVRPLVMPEERSINIDTLLDFQLAEAMIANS